MEKPFFIVIQDEEDNYDRNTSKILIFLEKVRDQSIKYGFANISKQGPKNSEVMYFSIILKNDNHRYEIYCNLF